MKEPYSCLGCSAKPCKKTNIGTFDICVYGIAFFHSSKGVEKKEPSILVSSLSRNLRHEINPILQTIIEQAAKLDTTVSTKQIDLNNPVSVIVGSTVILDNFIQMITGIQEFHTLASHSEMDFSKKVRIFDIITNYFNIFAILKEEERAKNLTLKNSVNKDIYISQCSDFISYILAVLIDNAWKYSCNDASLVVVSTNPNKSKIDIKITNKSKVIEDKINIFDLGVKGNPNSKGFGYGLYWAKLLEAHYNIATNNSDEESNFKILHSQLISSETEYAFHEFTLKNIIISEK